MKKENSLYIETGSFKEYGGWVLDTQFIPNMGSAYLLAHGLGEPVCDAKTKAVFPQTGEYHVWVYTKDWVAPWKKGCAPGLFELFVDHKKANVVFGNQGEDWHWQNGGKIMIENCEAELLLHDLTGFEGRCGGLFFTMDGEFIPPVELKELSEFKQLLCNHDKEVFCGEFDIVIAGGGIAGICAALSSARNGLKTALVQDRPVVGGNNSSEVRVWLGGKTNFEPYPNIGNIVLELEQEIMEHYGEKNRAEIYEDEKKFHLLNKEENITLFMEHFLISSEVIDNEIKSVLLYDVKTGAHKRLKAGLFLDSTGDAHLGYVSGADFEVTTNGHMGITNVWHIKDTGEEQKFPQCPWAIDLSKADFPGRKDVPSVYNQKREIAFGGWYWESGCEHDPIEKAEYARDTNFRAMYGAWDCVKNTDYDYKTYKLGNCTYIGGKRESSDLKNGYQFPDACVPSTWNFDVHYPDRHFYAAFHEGDAFLTFDYHEKFQTPYFVPYRILYSRNIKNLFMAGRNVSVTHDALGTVRVMRTGGMMGEVVGKAAYLCKKYNVNPRGVYEKHLDELIEMLK